MENNNAGSGFAIGELREMAQIVKDNGLTKLAISQGEFMILMESKQEALPVMFPPVMSGISGGTEAPSAQTAQQTAPQTAAQTTPQAAAPVPDGNIVKSPIVGTFYAASAPDKPPFVTKGQSVKKGDVLMVIESMKLMNEIHSDFDGTVSDIMVKNGDPVEFDQALMVIK